MLPNKKLKFSDPSKLDASPSAVSAVDSMGTSPADPSTPTRINAINPASELSPPDSHRGVNISVNGQRNNSRRSSRSGTIENSNLNGKRPLGDVQSFSGGGKHLHRSSGYTWDRPEDEPGHAWKGKKASDEFNKAMEQIVDKQRVVGNRYDLPIGEGDISSKFE